MDTTLTELLALLANLTDDERAAVARVFARMDAAPGPMASAGDALIIARMAVRGVRAERAA